MELVEQKWRHNVLEEHGLVVEEVGAEGLVGDLARGAAELWAKQEEERAA